MLKILTKYANINNLPKSIQPYLENEFKQLYQVYGDDTELFNFDISEFGEFAIIVEAQSDLADIHTLGFDESFDCLTIEFAEIFKDDSGTIFYDVYILKDTDRGTRFIIDSTIIDKALTNLLEKECNH